jgi:hypothetical protein
MLMPRSGDDPKFALNQNPIYEMCTIDQMNLSGQLIPTTSTVSFKTIGASPILRVPEH